MAYSKCFSAQTLIVCYRDFTKKQNSDYLDIMTCDNWVLKIGKKMKILILRRFFYFCFGHCIPGF